MQRSSHIQRLAPNYIFAQIKIRVDAYLKEHPDGRKLISLALGDTTHPLPESISNELSDAALKLATDEGYKGYNPLIGLDAFRASISENIYHGLLAADEITISDGIKPDLARFALLSGGKQRVAIQDPSYPVYLETSQLVGDEVILLPATKENGFFPDWCSLKGPHLLFLCSPNNPTGVAATKQQLQKIVDHARKEGMLILFDAAYQAYVTDPSIPTSIFEIEGAKSCAIEWGSFSKSAGFSGLRLGWCAMSKELRYSTGESILTDWKRVLHSSLNGVSYLSQIGGIKALSEEGQRDLQQIVKGYLDNARLIKEALTKKGIQSYGGIHTPFIWADFSPKTSWEAFDELLTKYQIVTTPGVGFGSAGEGFIRFSALGKPHDLLDALHRLSTA